MMLAILGFDYHVINIAFYCMMHQITKNTCHGTLVSCTSILQSEWHDGVVEISLWGPESGVNGVIGIHLDLVVA